MLFYEIHIKDSEQKVAYTKGNKNPGCICKQGCWYCMSGAKHADGAEIDCQDVERGLSGPLHCGDQERGKTVGIAADYLAHHSKSPGT